MKLPTHFALMALLAAAAAQAEEPKEPVPAVASVTEAPPAKTAEQLAAEDKAVREKVDKDKAWQVKQMRAAGYKPNTRKDGTVLWCRNETPIGSHLEQQRCSTIEQVLDTQKKGQELTGEMFNQANRGIKSQ
jgi:hypothetical protein